MQDLRPFFETEHFIETKPEILATLLGTLFYIVARKSRETLIRVYAHAYDDRAAIHIKDNSEAGAYGILYEFQHVKILSREIGGFLEINTYKNRETTISFNFVNDAPADTAILPELRRA